MKVTKILGIMALLTMIFSPMNGFADEGDFSASADLSVMSKYIWRGFEFSDDSIVIQPSITVSYKGFSGRGILGQPVYALAGNHEPEVSMSRLMTGPLISLPAMVPIIALSSLATRLLTLMNSILLK